MAYQIKQRDPLLDTNMQISLARRGREGLGVLMALLGLAIAAMLISYNPADPSWLAATDAPATNWLGLFGAYLTAPVILVLGYGAWGFAAGLVAWGIRFAFHLGSERALPRALFVAGWVLILSVYAASLRPMAGWAHDFGLGGLFGDTVMGALLSVLPISAAIGLKILSLVIAVVALLSGAWVLGFTREDLRKFGLFLLAGLGTILMLIRLGTGYGVRAAAKGTSASATKLADLRARRAERAAEED
ncbi:MAG: DNA translocase FtsK 4TM domain-containing protein, partial [Pseudomonadota bacterium]